VGTRLAASTLYLLYYSVLLFACASLPVQLFCLPLGTITVCLIRIKGHVPGRGSSFRILHPIANQARQRCGATPGNFVKDVADKLLLPFRAQSQNRAVLTLGVEGEGVDVG
jgi:hypothetical protein